MAGRRPGGKNYAPIVRSMIANCLEGDRRDEIRKKIESAMIEDPIRTLRDLAWAVPKEVKADVSTKFSIEDFVTGAVASQIADDSGAEETNIH